jgi:hypothetical protein
LTFLVPNQTLHTIHVHTSWLKNELAERTT